MCNTSCQSRSVRPSSIAARRLLEDPTDVEGIESIGVTAQIAACSDTAALLERMMGILTHTGRGIRAVANDAYEAEAGVDPFNGRVDRNLDDSAREIDAGPAQGEAREGAVAPHRSSRPVRRSLSRDSWSQDAVDCTSKPPPPPEPVRTADCTVSRNVPTAGLDRQVRLSGDHAFGCQSRELCAFALKSPPAIGRAARTESPDSNAAISRASSPCTRRRPGRAPPPAAAGAPQLRARRPAEFDTKTAGPVDRRGPREGTF